MSNYTTGEMAKLCNVTVRTVQFYDTKGILHPSGLTVGGRRIYNDDDLRKFQLICMLKGIGLSLSAIKNVMESELSGKILTILLDEQVGNLTSEIKERQKQLEMIKAIKESICNEAVIPANTILDIEDMMEKKNKVQGKKTLMIVYLGVGVACVLGLWLLIWLIWSQIWWAVVVYGFFSIFGLSLSAFMLKEMEFICPGCNTAFKPPLRRAFFSTGSHEVRWATCPECKYTGWCVLRKQIREKSSESSA